MQTLLPPNSSAIEQAIDQVAATRLSMDLSAINTDPRTCHVSLLPWLATALQLDISGLSIPEQRSLIATGTAIHRHKGTISAVQKALNSVFQNARISQFNQPFIFDATVTFSADTNAVYSAAKFDTAKRLVSSAKNLGSRFGSFKVDMPPAHTNVKITGHAQWML